MSVLFAVVCSGCFFQFGPLRVKLQPAAAAIRVGSVVSSRSLTASVHSAFCTVVGTHVSNEVCSWTALDAVFVKVVCYIIIIIINIFKVALIMKLLLGPHRYRRVYRLSDNVRV